MEKINGDANINAISESLRSGSDFSVVYSYVQLICVQKISGVPKFVYVSTVENNLPNFVLSGWVNDNQSSLNYNVLLKIDEISYFNGKRRAEQALLDAFPETGVVLRPGFIYGTRDVPLPIALHSITGPELKIPLWLIGK